VDSLGIDSTLKMHSTWEFNITMGNTFMSLMLRLRTSFCCSYSVLQALSPYQRGTTLIILTCLEPRLMPENIPSRFSSSKSTTSHSLLPINKIAYVTVQDHVSSPSSNYFNTNYYSLAISRLFNTPDQPYLPS
jgi:hypothetical protein